MVTIYWCNLERLPLWPNSIDVDHNGVGAEFERTHMITKSKSKFDPPTVYNQSISYFADSLILGDEALRPCGSNYKRNKTTTNLSIMSYKSVTPETKKRLCRKLKVKNSWTM